MIVDRLIEQSHTLTRGRALKDVRVGLGYTAVQLEDGACGVAFTFRNELGKCCGAFNGAGRMIGLGSDELVEWAREPHLLKSAVGLATINAVLRDALSESTDGNVVEALELTSTDTFGMVGDFAPILAEVRRQTDKIYVFEKKHQPGDGTYPSEAIPEYLPTCNVVVVTATSIINHTIDGILDCCNNARQVAIVGPSTPMCPEAFADKNVTVLAGSVVTDAEKLLQIVSQGGGTPAMKPAMEQVLIRL